MEGGDAVLHPGVVEEALSAPRRRLEGFDLSEGLSKEGLWCLELARKVSLNEVEEDDLESLLKSISKELMTKDIEDLEKQRRQWEEEVEAGQQPTVPQTKEMTINILQGFHGLLHQTMDYMENMDPDFERSGLKRWQVMEMMAYYEDLLSE